jgi:hypothetical protein
MWKNHKVGVVVAVAYDELGVYLGALVFVLQGIDDINSLKVMKLSF